MSFEAPNYTQTPNAFFDELLPQIDSVTELKVTLSIIRQTLGWHRDEDVLSVSRLEDLTGLPRKSVQDGIERALKRGSITRRKSSNTFSYRLNVVTSGEHSSKPSFTSGERTSFTSGGPQKKEERKRTKEVEESDNLRYMDPAMDQCLLLLGKVKNFPRDNVVNYRRLSECRSDFPNVDPVEVVKDYRAYCQERPIAPNSNPRMRLRNFFKQAEKRWQPRAEFSRKELEPPKRVKIL